jgi:hypothetical protein
MKFFGTLIASISMAGAAAADTFATEAPSSGGGADNALILLLLIGAVVFLGGQGTRAGKAEISTQTDQDDSDVIMKF